MKHLFILAMLISGILICQPIDAEGFGKAKPRKVSARQTLIDVVATNSTSVSVNVYIQNQVTGVSYSFVVPPNVSGAVVSQVPKSEDYYRINMWSSTAVKMRFYWAESSGPTIAFSTENVPLARCETCPTINIE
ncbi:hypothetical protein [Olivibacter jilunii]|uniref:hypothetical protein n=1 Tax=Olivibacter jilunii TaxID=985016 RepID=UPI003F174313